MREPRGSGGSSGPDRDGDRCENADPHRDVDVGSLERLLRIERGLDEVDDEHEREDGRIGKRGRAQAARQALAEDCRQSGERGRGAARSEDGPTVRSSWIRSPSPTSPSLRAADCRSAASPHSRIHPYFSQGKRKGGEGLCVPRATTPQPHNPTERLRRRDFAESRHLRKGPQPKRLRP